MDPTKLPVAVLLALGLSGCGLKDRLGPCLSVQQLDDSGSDDSGSDDSGSDDSGSDDSGSDDSGSDDSGAADAQAAADRARLLQRAQVDGALPSDVVERLRADP